LTSPWWNRKGDEIDRVAIDLDRTLMAECKTVINQKIRPRIFSRGNEKSRIHLSPHSSGYRWSDNPKNYEQRIAEAGWQFFLVPSLFSLFLKKPSIWQ